jgi:hypothetical protein
MIPGDLITSRLKHESVAIWATPHYETYLGEINPGHIGIILERITEPRNSYRVLIDGNVAGYLKHFLRGSSDFCSDPE